MAKIIEYGIIAEEDVNKFIAAGFQPYGSPVVGSSGRFFQAMVKYEEDDLTSPVVVKGVYQSEDSRRAYLQNLGQKKIKGSIDYKS